MEDLRICDQELQAQMELFQRWLSPRRLNHRQEQVAMLRMGNSVWRNSPIGTILKITSPRSNVLNVGVQHPKGSMDFQTGASTAW